LGEGVIISADVQSRTRRDVTHYSRIVLDPLSLKVVKATCSCEAGSFGKKCWHLKTLEQLMASEELRGKDREGKAGNDANRGRHCLMGLRIMQVQLQGDKLLELLEALYHINEAMKIMEGYNSEILDKLE